MLADPHGHASCSQRSNFTFTMPHRLLQPLRFGAFELRARTRQLLLNGVEVAIGGRAFDLLCTLAAHRHDVLSQDELLKRVWPDVSVEPNNLQVQIWSLRRLLGAKAIATVPRRGYRFTPELVDAPAAHAPQRAESAATVQRQLLLHRRLTLVGEELVALEQLALACAREHVRHSQGQVWLGDGSSLAARAEGSPVLARVQMRADAHADVLVLRHAHVPSRRRLLAALVPTEQTAQLRVLLLSPRTLSIGPELRVPGGRVATVATDGGSPLRWHRRG